MRARDVDHVFKTLDIRKGGGENEEVSGSLERSALLLAPERDERARTDSRIRRAHVQLINFSLELVLIEKEKRKKEKEIMTHKGLADPFQLVCREHRVGLKSGRTNPWPAENNVTERNLN